MKINNKSLQVIIAILGLLILLFPVFIRAEGNVGLTLTLRPTEYYHEVIAGHEGSFSLEIKNSGDTSLTNIKLSAITPEEIVILIEPDSIESLLAGNIQQVSVTIKPGVKIESGEYLVAFMAEANETRKVEVVWVKVKSSSFWLWLWGGIATVVVIGCVFLYLRLNRKIP